MFGGSIPLLSATPLIWEIITVTRTLKKNIRDVIFDSYRVPCLNQIFENTDGITSNTIYVNTNISIWQSFEMTTRISIFEALKRDIE